MNVGDLASSHMLVSKIMPYMVTHRMAQYSNYDVFDGNPYIVTFLS